MGQNMPALSMRHITKRFGSKVIANNDVSLDIYSGEILALLGENGSGKTTLMNMLSGIYYPDEGQIFLNGKEVSISSPREAAISLVGKNTEFKAIHEYYRTRKENPLKKMQSVVAVACKILRVFYTILTKGVDYDPLKLMGDIKRPQLQAA